MMKNKKKKKSFTLVELMVVIVIIGLIGSVVTYNVRGSLEKGKRFKTEQAAKMIHDVVDMEVATGLKSLKDFEKSPAKFLKDSGMVKDAKMILKDGWGAPFHFDISEEGALVISSPHYNNG